MSKTPKLSPAFPKAQHPTTLPVRIDRSRVTTMQDAMARDLCLYPVDEQDNVCGCDRWDNGRIGRPSMYCAAHYSKVMVAPKAPSAPPALPRRFR